jgi:hypothetical protein
MLRYQHRMLTTSAVKAAAAWCVILGTSATGLELGLSHSSSVRQPKFQNPEDT